MLPPNCSEHSHAADVAVASLLLLECGLGALGNAVALWTFFFHLKVWKPYAIYLLNLVLADLLLASCLPFHAAFYLRHKSWGLGRASCQALRFLRALCRGAGVAFLTAVTLDRCLRVVHSRLRVNALSLRAAWGISALVWLLVAGLTHQSALLSEAERPSSEPQAGSSFSRLRQEALFFLQFILPFGLILFCSAGVLRALPRRLREPDKQPKLRRAQALVAAVVVLFALCFLPCFVARVLLAALRGARSCRLLSALAHAADVTGSLTCLQGVLSPAFRRSYRQLFFTRTLRAAGSMQRPRPGISETQIPEDRPPFPRRASRTGSQDSVPHTSHRASKGPAHGVHRDVLQRWSLTEPLLKTEKVEPP